LVSVFDYYFIIALIELNIYLCSEGREGLKIVGIWGKNYNNFYLSSFLFLGLFASGFSGGFPLLLFAEDVSLLFDFLGNSLLQDHNFESVEITQTCAFFRLLLFLEGLGQLVFLSQVFFLDRFSDY
jgi:hypothetical protein